MSEASLVKRLKKSLTKRAMKYLATPQGLVAFNRFLQAKKQTDRRLAAVYQLFGLPSLHDKQQVEWVVDRQARRVRGLSEDLEALEHAVARLEESWREPPAPVVDRKAAPSKPAPRKRPRRTVKPPRPKKTARTKKPTRAATRRLAVGASRPKPLGAANLEAGPVVRKALLDLDWKGKPKRKR
jgi:hypothetical protein